MPLKQKNWINLSILTLFNLIITKIEYKKIILFSILHFGFVFLLFDFFVFSHPLLIYAFMILILVFCSRFILSVLSCLLNLRHFSINLGNLFPMPEFKQPVYNIYNYHCLFSFLRIDNPSHPMTDTTLIQSFISFSLITILITNSNQKQSSLSTINSNLPDNLIKTLIIEFLSDRTDTNLFCLLE